MKKPQHTLGDAPIQDEYIEQMNALGRVIDELFNGEEVTMETRKIGFVLLVFPFEDDGVTTNSRCNFLSNGANRNDIIALFKEMISRFEGQPQSKGGRA